MADSPRTAPGGAARLRTFVTEISALVESTRDEAGLLDAGRALLAQLVRHDDRLPDEFAAPDPARYRQYLLHDDGRERLSVVSFVWGPGQSTPIHDHTVWGLVGVHDGRPKRFVSGYANRALPNVWDRSSAA